MCEVLGAWLTFLSFPDKDDFGDAVKLQKPDLHSYRPFKIPAMSTGECQNELDPLQSFNRSLSRLPQGVKGMSGAAAGAGR